MCAWFIDEDSQRESETILFWYRPTRFESFYSKNDYYLTHGHTPLKDGPVRSQNRINLDSGAVFYGKLSVAEYEYDTKGPINIHEYTL